MDTALSLGTLRGRTLVKEAMQLPSDIGGVVLLGLERRVEVEKTSFVPALMTTLARGAGSVRGVAGRLGLGAKRAGTAARKTGTNLMGTFGRAARAAGDEAKLFGDFAGQAMKGTAAAASRGAQVGRSGLKNLSLYGNRTTLRGFRDARKAGLNIADSLQTAGGAGRARSALREANKNLSRGTRDASKAARTRADATRRLEFAQARGLSDDVVGRLQGESAQATAAQLAQRRELGRLKARRGTAQTRFNTATGRPQPQRLPAQSQAAPAAPAPQPKPQQQPRPQQQQQPRQQQPPQQQQPPPQQQQPPPAATPSTPPTEPPGVMDAVARNIRNNPLMAAGLAGTGGVALGALID